jgi:yecA family protein
MKMKSQHCYWSDLIECCRQEVPSVELKTLDNFLRNKSLPGGCTSLSMADGFLTALIVGPPLIPRKPYQGLELVWGDTSKNPMKGKATKQEEIMLDMLYRHVNHIYERLEFGRSEYEPIIDNRYVDSGAGKEAPELPSIVSWCRGFMKFFALNPQAWAPIFETEKGRTLINPIRYCGTEDGWPNGIGGKNNGKSFLELLTDHLPYFVFGIKDHFLTPFYVEDIQWYLNKLSQDWSIPKEHRQTEVGAA